MLARVTYALVIVAVGTLVGGFFTEESNVLLFVSIGLSVAAIVLVLVGWARRAREAPAFETEAGEEEEEALLEALDEEELAFVEERRPRRTSRAKRPTTKAKAKPKPRAKPRTASTGRRRTSSAARKPQAARKTKPKSAGKGSARPKRKPPRRPPSSR